MSAREEIEFRLGVQDCPDETKCAGCQDARDLADRYRAEVLAKAIGRLRAIPVTCTALTGPVWYGDGWNSAITCLEEIADYQTPDNEQFPGELEALRALVLNLRARARTEDWDMVLWLLDEHRKREKATAEAATATPDFFQPGHTYTEPGDTTDWKFRCDSITTHPEDGERTALGWRHFRGQWEPYAYGEDDFEIHQIADHINTTQGDSK